MFVFDVCLHMFLVYSALFVIFLTYGIHETTSRVKHLIIDKFSPIVIKYTIPIDVRDKLVELGVPSTCQKANNSRLLHVGISIWLGFFILVLSSTMFANITKEGIQHVIIQNAVIFTFVLILEILFINSVILKFTPITNAEISDTLDTSIMKNLQ